MVRQNSSPTTGVMDSQLQLAQTINRNTFGFASRVVQVNLNNPTAQAATSHPRPSTISPSSSSSATSVGGQPKSQSNSNTSQTGNPTAPQNKTEAQQTQRIDTAEKFLVAAKKLNEMRTQYEGQSGIGKYLPGSKSKTAMRAARQALGQQIQNHPFSQDPQINKQMVGLWLATASGLSPKDQKVIYNQIQQKLLGSEYRSEILQMLNEQAKNNPLIEGIRDAYNIKAESDRILGGFRSNLTAALNGSTEDKIAFIKQFEGNLNLNNQPLQIIQEEQAAIKALLAKDNLTPSNRVFLQQMDLAYEMKLNENNPKKMLELASRFMELERPLLQQV
ncbi:MAG: hypothetical protein LBB19_03100, partial [Puniceicoccales bacterium]|nr:hypothetical protein [Puniceicoccales bacterium]